MLKFFLTISVMMAVNQFLMGQDSIPVKQLEEVIVTATRNERTMGALPMPVTLVQKSQIKSMGSLRLNDVLVEQTGLTVVPQVNGSGNGIQLQGFNPDYTLILMDGEPLIGRFTGSLDLSRVTVGNIKQIEVVKGPSSSLYGSDALAGVVNIITDRPLGQRGSFFSRYGTNNTLDLSGDLGFNSGKLGVYVFADRYSTDGYDLSPETYGKTVAPFSNYTGNFKITYKISPKTNFSLSGRYFSQDQNLDDKVSTPSSGEIRETGVAHNYDWNLNPVVIHRLSDRMKLTGRFYATHYETSTKLFDHTADTLYYSDSFRQTFVRPELNGEYYFNDKNILTVGLGEIFETVETSRYGDEAPRNQQTRYVFFQEELKPFEKLSLIVGARLDHNSIYGSQLSPKLSGRYEISKKIILKASYGVGFKSPDFRQLYLNFSNTAGGGYSVFGTEVVNDKLAELQAEGRILTYLYDPSLIGKLRAESSQAFNLGFHWDVFQQLKVDANGFYNSIDNLIETQAVAVTTSNQTIYSYRNITRAYTAGSEINASYPLGKSFNLSLGYQLLYAKDKDVAEQVANGTVYWRDPVTLVTQRLKPGEYYGLYNRSRHMGNVKLFFANRETGWEGSLRVIYRGPYGIGDSAQGGDIPSSDRNGNSILDVYDHFVSGYALTNISAAKNFQSGIRLQAGVDNVFDYKDPIYISNIAGRLMYLSVSYAFSKNKSQSSNQ